MWGPVLQMTVGFGVAGRVLSAPWPCSEPAPRLQWPLACPKSIRNLLWTGLLPKDFSGRLDLWSSASCLHSVPFFSHTFPISSFLLFRLETPPKPLHCAVCLLSMASDCTWGMDPPQRLFPLPSFFLQKCISHTFRQELPLHYFLVFPGVFVTL